MTALVSVETILLVLMLVLVAGLLRSHAEILRRLETGGHGSASEQIPRAPIRGEAAPAFDVAGTSLDKHEVALAVTEVAHDTLLAFLSSGCLTCKGFWDELGRGVDVPGDARLVVVTRDGSHESPSKLRGLAAPDLTVVMSSASWDEYEVPMSPYFVYVDGASGKVAGEGSAQTWGQVASLVRDALVDRSDPPGAGDRRGRAEHELAAAGIGPDHVSLYEADDPSVQRRLGVIP
jgi:hypothetical protein